MSVDQYRCDICCVFSNVYFFFFKQKTAYELRISDWSSDVCSSDLQLFVLYRMPTLVFLSGLLLAGSFGKGIVLYLLGKGRRIFWPLLEIGRASCRERVCQYV